MKMKIFDVKFEEYLSAIIFSLQGKRIDLQL